MAYSESPFSSSSSSSRPKWNYDVFLSFRGEDTRKTITDHLYSALIRAGIHTFRDDNELPRGEEISPQLLMAIEGSRISVVVFSRNYASSRWCLDELVKIIECRQKIHQVVLPIFYDMDPSDIRKQTGSYAKAFDEHEEHFKGEMEKVNRWREALAQAANLSGYGLKNDTNGYEAEFIKRVVNDVACKLGNKTLHVAKHPVDISSRVCGVISLLRGATNSVGIVGIYGIAGIGKTTIAKVVFNILYSRFEGSSFLLGVKETSDKPNGLVELQERLLHDILQPNVWKIRNVYEGMNLIKERLHRKNVLVVFDDVDNREQVKALMGDRCWFGAGSKIIVVTKNKHLLTEVEVDGMYHAKELDRDQSLQLFSLHAFRETRPAKDYEELSEKVVDYCKGLPLALEILGSHLSIRDKAGWKIDIAHWQNILHDDIQAKLRVSFDALDVDSREIFLDIACFFVGKDKDYVADIVSARYRCHPEVAFRTLIGRSLIRIDTENQNKLWMHDIVRKMGREIICRRSDNHPENYSRIVVPEDARNVLSKEMGTEAVKGLALDVPGSFSTKSFTKMRRLELLQITGAHLAGSYSLLPRELIWLCWPGCPLKSLPSDFHLSELVILDMQGSKVRKLWKGTKILNKLKILNLSYSNCLVKTPNFRGLPSLERLILVDCTSLVEVHRSIGNLKSLVLLNLEGCNSLKSLPESMGSLKSLQTLNVTRCSQLEKLPGSLGSLESLTLLNLELCYSLKTLPKSMGSLKSLQTLNFTRCSQLAKLPDSLGGLESLTLLNLEGCNSLKSLPESMGSLKSLQTLNVTRCSQLEKLPGSLGSLESLTLLNLELCYSLKSLPESMGSLKSLQTLNFTRCSQLAKLPDSLGGLESLTLLNLEFCYSLKSLPESMGSLKSLQTLNVTRCSQLEKLPGSLGSLESLTLLNLELCYSLKTLPDSMGSLKSLETLNFTRCLQLAKLPDGLGGLESLTLLNLEFCYSLKSLPESMGSLKSLQTLNVTRCSQLEKLPGSLGSLESLTLLNLELCYSLKTLPESMGSLKSLQTLNVTRCSQLEKLPGSLGSLESLTLLNLELCYSLKTLPESMGSLKSLQTLNVTECSQLEKLPDSLGGLESLTELFVKGTAIKQLPTSARYLKKLTKLSFGGFYSPDPPSKSRFSRFFSPQSCSSSIAMRLDSFTSFTSLKKLDLRDAGLSDAISSIDFGSFSFLEDLDLSGFRFFNLPSSISRLPKLQHFLVERCENLLSISELPSNLASFSIRGCKSIERVIAPLRSKRLEQWGYEWCPNLIEVQATDWWDNNLSEDEDLRDKYKMSSIQSKYYEISLAGGEIPEWFSHRGEGSSLSFHSPSVPDGNKLQALLVWVVFASTNEATALTPFLQRDICSATLKNKSNGATLKHNSGVEIFDKKAVLNFGRNSTKLSWIQRVPTKYYGLEESLQGVEELELNVEVRGLSDARKCWVEKCGVHLIMEKDKADSDSDSDSDSDWTEYWNRTMRASTPDDQRMQNILIRELQEGKIIGSKDVVVFDYFDKNNS